jgi:hypothetical protein
LALGSQSLSNTHGSPSLPLWQASLMQNGAVIGQSLSKVHAQPSVSASPPLVDVDVLRSPVDVEDVDPDDVASLDEELEDDVSSPLVDVLVPVLAGPLVPDVDGSTLPVVGLGPVDVAPLLLPSVPVVPAVLVDIPDVDPPTESVWLPKPDGPESSEQPQSPTIMNTRAIRRIGLLIAGGCRSRC